MELSYCNPSPRSCYLLQQVSRLLKSSFLHFWQTHGVHCKCNASYLFSDLGLAVASFPSGLEARWESWSSFANNDPNLPRVAARAAGSRNAMQGTAVLEECPGNLHSECGGYVALSRPLLGLQKPEQPLQCPWPSSCGSGGSSLINVSILIMAIQASTALLSCLTLLMLGSSTPILTTSVTFPLIKSKP